MVLNTAGVLQFGADSYGIQNRTSALALAFAGALSINGGNLTFKNFIINATGTTNTITSYVFSLIPFNCDYTIGIVNSGTGNLTFNQVTASGFIFNGNVNFVVPTGRYATVRIQKIAIGGTTHFMTGTLF
jgi:hypothetical protein